MTMLPAIDLKQFVRPGGYIDQFPAIAYREVEIAFNVILKTFWKRFLAQIPFKRRGPFSIRNVRRWPIVVERRGSQVYGRIQGDPESEAIFLFEFGGQIRSARGQYMAFPVGNALSKTGRRKKHYSGPAERRARGEKFISLRNPRTGVIYLHKLVPAMRRGRGRPRKDRKNPIPMRPLDTPTFRLEDAAHFKRGYLGFFRTAESHTPQVQKSMRIALERTIRLARKAVAGGGGVSIPALPGAAGPRAS